MIYIGQNKGLSRFILLLTVTVTICTGVSSCRPHAKPTQIHHAANIDYTRLFSKIQGTWISYEYVLNLYKTRSPYLSAEFMDGIFSFTIDSDNLHNDTLHCIALVNGREENGLWIAFDTHDSAGYSIGLNKAQQYDNYQGAAPNENITRIKIDSTFLTIYTNTFDSIRYIRYSNLPKRSPADFALKQYTTKALFHGEYQTNDSGRVFGASRIYFDPVRVGRISGSPIYDSFDINADVLAQSDSQDYMELFDSRKQTESRSFTYKIRKNVLRIYELTDSMPFILYKPLSDDSMINP